MRVYEWVFYFWYLQLPTLAIYCEVPKNYVFTINSSNSIEVVDSENNYIGQAVVRTIGSLYTTELGNIEWIWSDYEKINADTAYLRSEFYLNDIPSSAILQVAANDIVNVYVNNKNTTCSGANRYNVKTCDLVQDFILGKNKIIFEGKNNGGNAGIVFSLKIKKNL